VGTIQLVEAERLRHIEDFDPERVAMLARKIEFEGVWTLPLAIDDTHDLVLDGQHRTEVARELGLRFVPALRFRYADLSIRSLRPEISFTWEDVVAKVLSGSIYPYKTVKHDFDVPLPPCAYRLGELQRGC
jgi:hypothetical protein